MPTNGLHVALKNVETFAALGGVALRSYQREAARAIVDSVLGGRGLSIVVLFPRQSGKNELQAWVEAYLLCLLARRPADLVKVAPTWSPQCQNATRRLERALDRHPLTRGRWFREHGYTFNLGCARMAFASAAPESHVVGLTASALLEVDEAQDVLPGKYDRDVAPMAASTNATRVFWGTAWTADTLLARELRAARALEQVDGLRRVFRATADDVSAEAPEYGRFVAAQVARFGRDNPLVRTQYFCEEIETGGGMFPLDRLEKLSGQHLLQEEPRAGAAYALLLDVGGEEPLGAGQAAPGRDRTALAVVDIERRVDGPPIYRLTRMYTWAGESHARLYDQILALARFWRPRRVVIDATGLGQGLAAFLERALPGRVTRFVFSAASKSRLGWQFLDLIDSGRFQLPTNGGRWGQLLREQFCACTAEAGPGESRPLRWGVPEGARSPSSGEPLHDDMLLACALCAVLDQGPQPAPPGSGVLVVPGRDPLETHDRF